MGDLKDVIGEDLTYALILQGTKTRQTDEEYYLYRYDPDGNVDILYQAPTDGSSGSGGGMKPVSEDNKIINMFPFEQENPDFQVRLGREKIAGYTSYAKSNLRDSETKYGIIGVKDYDRIYQAARNLDDPSGVRVTEYVSSRLVPDSQGKISDGIFVEDFLPTFKNLLAMEDDETKELIGAKKVIISNEDLEKLKKLYTSDEVDAELEANILGLIDTHNSGTVATSQEEKEEEDPTPSDDEFKDTPKDKSVPPPPGGDANDQAAAQVAKIEPVKINRTFKSGSSVLDDEAKTEISEKMQPFIDFALDSKYSKTEFTITVIAGTSKVPRRSGTNAELAAERATAAKTYIEEVLASKNVEGVKVKLGKNKVEEGPEWEANKSEGVNWGGFTKHQFVEMDLSVSGELANERKNVKKEKEVKNVETGNKDQKQSSEKEEKTTVVTTEKEEEEFSSYPKSVKKGDWAIYNRYGGARGNFQPSYVLDPQNDTTREYFESDDAGKKVLRRMVNGILLAIYNKFYGDAIIDRNYDVDIDYKGPNWLTFGLTRAISVKHRVPLIMTKPGVTDDIKDAIKNKIPKGKKKELDFKLTVSLPRGQYEINPDSYINENDSRIFEKLLREIINQ